MPPPKKKEGGESDKVPLLILRRKSGHGEHGHHGGAWKIAYADFVTAMMAFFLLMWLLNSTNKSDKQGIADFFNRPISVALGKGNSSSASASIINGGGTDLMSKTSAEVAHGDDSKKQNAVLVPNATSQRSADEQDSATPGMVMPATDPSSTQPPRAESPDDTARLKALKDRIDKMIQMNAKLAQFKDQIRVEITSEGLRIQIVDAQNRPMFQTGRAELEPYAKEILDQIGLALNDVPNHLSIAGHTDSAAYAGAVSGYSNWELSSERANSARRELGIGGLKELKVLQVRGLADALPLEKDDPSAPANRRISILVLNKKTEDAFYRDGGRMDLGTPGAATKPVDAPKPTATTPAPAQSFATNRTSSPDGGSPDNHAASPEAVVARIKAAVDSADPAPRVGAGAGTGAGASGKAGQAAGQTAGQSASQTGSQRAQAAIVPAQQGSIAPAGDAGHKHGSPSQQDAPVAASTHGGSGIAPVKTGAAATSTSGVSPTANATSGAISAQIKSGLGAAAGAGNAPTQANKVSAGAIAPPVQKVSSGAIQPAPSAPATEHNSSDFGSVQ